MIETSSTHVRLDNEVQDGSWGGLLYEAAFLPRSLRWLTVIGGLLTILAGPDLQTKLAGDACVRYGLTTQNRD